MAAGAADLGRPSATRAHDRAHALHHHHAAEVQSRISRRARSSDRAGRAAQQREQRDARGGADQAADQQHQGEGHIERAPPSESMAPEKEEAATWLATLATATAGISR